MRKLARLNGLILVDVCHGLYHSMSCIHDGKASMCQCYELMQGSMAYSSLRKRVIMMLSCEIMRLCNVFIHWLVPIV